TRRARCAILVLLFDNCSGLATAGAQIEREPRMMEVNDVLASTLNAGFKWVKMEATERETKAKTDYGEGLPEVGDYQEAEAAFPGICKGALNGQSPRQKAKQVVAKIEEETPKLLTEVGLLRRKIVEALQKIEATERFLGLDGQFYDTPDAKKASDAAYMIDRG